MRDYTTRFVTSITGLLLLLAALWGGVDQDDAETPDTAAETGATTP
jgi:hypothetical protein